MVLATYFDNQGMIEGFRYKLIFNRSAGTFLLFDLGTRSGRPRSVLEAEDDVAI